MFDIGLAVTAAAIIALMSYMGVHVTVHPIKDPILQERFRLGFLGLGAVSVLLAGGIAYSSHVQIASLQSVVDARDRFFFYRANFLDTAQPRPLVQLRTITSDVFDVSAAVQVFSLDTGASRFLGEQQAPAAPGQGYLSAIAVQPGNYRIEFRGQNVSWVEFIEIYEATGLLSQCIRVERDHEPLHSECNRDR